MKQNNVLSEDIHDIISGYEDTLKQYLLPIERDKVRKKATKDICKLIQTREKALLERVEKEVIGLDPDEYGAEIREGKFTGYVKETGQEIPLRMINKENDQNELRHIQRTKLAALTKEENKE